MAKAQDLATEPQAAEGNWLAHLQLAMAILLGSALILGVSATLASVMESPDVDSGTSLQREGRGPGRDRKPHEWREARQAIPQTGPVDRCVTVL